MGNSLEQHRASIGAFNASSKRRRRIFASRSSNLVPIAAPIHLQLQQKQFSSNLMAQPMKELSNRHLQIQQWEENAKTDSEAGFRKQAKLVDNILEHTSRQVNQSKIVSENNWQEWACTDLKFVKKFTRPNFRAKEFYTLKMRKSRLLSPAINSKNASLSVIWPSFG